MNAKQKALLSVGKFLGIVAAVATLITIVVPVVIEKFTISQLVFGAIGFLIIYLIYQIYKLELEKQEYLDRLKDLEN